MFCPKCGSENFDTNKFCKKCGKQLPARTQGISLNFSMPRRPSLYGQVLDGKYRIEAKLGSGGMGDVYRATRLLIGDSVAIKILHPHLAIDPQAAERFRREAVTATQLRHRNVVAIFDVGISAVHNLPYILMELAEGFSLRQMINQYRVLPLDFVVTVAAQVCAALDEAHRLGIVHRDIKPENIIVNQTTAGWQVKVLDFGIAKLYNQADIGLTQGGSAIGTPQYMSPEQCMGEQLDGRSDIYSVGIVLYEMLCGTVPFKSATASAIAIFHVQKSPPALRSINPNIHPDVEAVILRSLEKAPNARQKTALQLSQEMIKAATTALKSGTAGVSAARIAAPDVEPEFSGEGLAISGSFERDPLASPALDGAHEVSAQYSFPSGSVQLQGDGDSADAANLGRESGDGDENLDESNSTAAAPDETDKLLVKHQGLYVAESEEWEDSIPTPTEPLSTSNRLEEAAPLCSGIVGDELLSKLNSESRISASVTRSNQIEQEADLSGRETGGFHRNRLWLILLAVIGLAVVGIAGAAWMGGFSGSVDKGGTNGPAAYPEVTNPPSEIVNQSLSVSSSSAMPAKAPETESAKSPPPKNEAKKYDKKKSPARSTRKPSNTGSKDWRCVYTNSC
jgi:serine/threonine protein kinase